MRLLTATRVVALLLAALLTVSCTAKGAANKEVLSLKLFHSPNGLLYPPEIWGFTQRYAPSASFRQAMLVLTGDLEADSLPPSTYPNLSEEVGAIRAAHALLSVGYPSSMLAPTWCSQRALDGFSGEATIDKDIQGLWLAVAVSQRLACGLPRLTDEMRDLIHETKLAPTSSPLQVWEAGDLERTFTGSTDIPPFPLTVDRVSDPNEAALYLLLCGERTRRSPLHADNRELLLAAEPYAQNNDLALLYLLRGMKGIESSASIRDLLNRVYDSRRLTSSDGEVLSYATFNGTTYSTFRMLMLARQSTGSSLDSTMRSELVSTLRAIKYSSSSEQAFALGALVLLSEDVPQEESHSLLRSSIREAGVELNARLGSPEEVGAWVKLRELSDVLHYELPFPGISVSCVSEIKELGPNGSTLAARLLLSINANDSMVGQDATLKDLYEAVLTEVRKGREGTSSSLFYGLLATHQVSKIWMLSTEEIHWVLDNRQAGCLGGARGLFREGPASPDLCTMDASLSALQVAHAIEGTSA